MVVTHDLSTNRTDTPGCARRLIGTARLAILACPCRLHPFLGRLDDACMGDVLLVDGQLLDGIAQLLHQHRPADALLSSHQGRLRALDDR